MNCPGNKRCWRSLWFRDDFGFLFCIFFDEQQSILTGHAESGKRLNGRRWHSAVYIGMCGARKGLGRINGVVNCSQVRSLRKTLIISLSSQMSQRIKTWYPFLEPVASAASFEKCMFSGPILDLWNQKLRFLSLISSPSDFDARSHLKPYIGS